VQRDFKDAAGQIVAHIREVGTVFMEAMVKCSQSWKAFVSLRLEVESLGEDMRLAWLQRTARARIGAHASSSGGDLNILLNARAGIESLLSSLVEDPKSEFEWQYRPALQTTRQDLVSQAERNTYMTSQPPETSTEEFTLGDLGWKIQDGFIQMEGLPKLIAPLKHIPNTDFYRKALRGCNLSMKLLQWSMLIS
jgi:hypothetical protein